MLVHESDNGRPPSHGEILKRPQAQPVYKILEILPYELIQVIVSHVTTVKDLRSLALVSKLFQGLAEPRVYRHVVIREGFEARILAKALWSKPLRAPWVRTLHNACHPGSFNGISELPIVVPMMTKLEELIIETPDCNSFPPDDRIPWITQQLEYNKIFLQAALPNANVLPNLRSCTLHFVDKHLSLYPLAHHSIIFLHPTLTTLTISCANIDPPTKLHPLLLQPALTNTTPLTTLNLIECDFHPLGLYHLLRLPLALTSLSLTEAIHFAPYVRHRRYPGLRGPDILHPIHPLQPHLNHLCISRLPTTTTTNNNPPNQTSPFSLPPLNLRPFTSLQTVEFAHIQPRSLDGPGVQNWCDHAAGPQHVTGGPNTTTLIYSSISSPHWPTLVSHFKCAFSQPSLHGISSLKVLKLILTDEEAMFGQRLLEISDSETDMWEGIDVVVERERQVWRGERKVVRKGVRELGALGKRVGGGGDGKAGLGIRVQVEWRGPTGRIIPPYLWGEEKPREWREYDSEEQEREQEPGVDFIAEGGT